MKKLSIYIFIIIALVIIDQVSKIYVAGNFYLGESVTVIDGFFNLTYVRNPGAAFGFGGAFQNWIRYSLFLALPVVACLWLVVLLVKSTTGPKVMTYAYTLILAGAVGNLIDRFRLDYVIDFFDFYIGKHHFATFNVADSAITIAAGLIILDFFQEKKRNKPVSAA
jgi:signal peptidase II